MTEYKYCVYVTVISKTLEHIKTFNTNYKDSSWDQNSIFKLNVLILTAKIPVKIKTQCFDINWNLKVFKLSSG